LLAVPVGSTEQHGPHLPLSTDTDIALALCQRLAVARDDVLVAPALAYGSSGEHADYPGTLSIGQDALETLVLELGRSATRTFPRVLFVSAHGGNTAPLARAISRLRDESRNVQGYISRTYGDLHAGRDETSMLLALSPERVRMARAVPGDLRPLSEIWPILRSTGVRTVSGSGVLGDPTDATADGGNELLDAISLDLISSVRGWLGGPT
jgi:creatinine amidohydrolase